MGVGRGLGDGDVPPRGELRSWDDCIQMCVSPGIWQMKLIAGIRHMRGAFMSVQAVVWVG